MEISIISGNGSELDLGNGLGNGSGNGSRIGSGNGSRIGSGISLEVLEIVQGLVW